MKSIITVDREEAISNLIECLKTKNASFQNIPEDRFDIKVKSKTGKSIDFKGFVIEVELD